MGWADFSAPLLHVAANRNDLLTVSSRSFHAEFSLIAIGWIGWIFGAAIQEYAIEMSGYQLSSAYARRTGRHVSIADACAGTDG